jgi:hypothetical protein
VISFLKILIVLLFAYNSSLSQQLNDFKSLFVQSYYNGFENKPPLRQYWMSLSKSRSIIDLQALSYGLDAVLTMFETTDNLTYLNDAISLTDNVINRAHATKDIIGNVSIYRDSYKGWIQNSSGKDTALFNQELVLSEIYFFQYVSRLLKDINNRPFVTKWDKYRTFYLTTLDFIEKNIWDKWESRGAKFKNDKYGYLLLVRTHMASHWAYIAAELSFLTKTKTRRNDYLNFVNLYNNILENNFQKYDKYISWNQTWNKPNSVSGIVQDVSHANLVVSYLVEANDLGLWKDFDAIQRIINTLKDKLWDPQGCIFWDNIDGTMFQAGRPHGSVGSFQADGFVKLTRYDQSLFFIYEQFINCSHYLINPWLQYGQLFANLALSEKLLNLPS